MLTVDVERAGDVAVVRCVGRIVRGAEVSILRNAVISAKDARTVVLDLSELDFMDAGGLSALVFLYNWTHARGMRLKLVHPSAFVRELLARTRLDRIADDFVARSSDTGRVCHRQVALVGQLLGRQDGNLAGRIRAMIFERGFADVFV